MIQLRSWIFQISRFPISAKYPPSFSVLVDAPTIPAEVREFSTMSTSVLCTSLDDLVPQWACLLLHPLPWRPMRPIRSCILATVYWQQSQCLENCLPCHSGMTRNVWSSLHMHPRGVIYKLVNPSWRYAYYAYSNTVTNLPYVSIDLSVCSDCHMCTHF